jgi:hypothetical protein
MTQTLQPLTEISVTTAPQGGTRHTTHTKTRHAIAEAFPQSSRYVTTCGRTIYGWTGPRTAFPVTCKTCTAKEA